MGRDISELRMLYFYGKNSCNTILGFGGENHYYIIPIKGRRSEPSRFEIRRASNDKLITTMNPDFKISCLKGNCRIEYKNSDNKTCTIDMMPCNEETKKDTYICPVRGEHFRTDEDWYKGVSNWFIMQGVKLNNISSAPDPTIATASEPQREEMAKKLFAEEEEKQKEGKLPPSKYENTPEVDAYMKEAESEHELGLTDKVFQIAKPPTGAPKTGGRKRRTRKHKGGKKHKKTQKGGKRGRRTQKGRGKRRATRKSPKKKH